VKIVQVDLAKRQMECVLGDGESRAAGKAKNSFDGRGKLLGGFSEGGGIGAPAGGAGFGAGGWDKATGKWRGSTGDQKRSQRSKSRDKGKNHRRDK
jgi:hypothetical protein